MRIRHAKILSVSPVRSFSPAVEDYLKAIYRLEAEAGGRVTTSALGGWLGVTASSASGMLKKLDDLQLIVYEPYQGVRLTPAWRVGSTGSRAPPSSAGGLPRPGAGLVLDKVHDEAEVLEHALSPGLCEVIAARLGDPRTDPHGDPIPTADGQVLEAPSAALGSLAPGQHGRAGAGLRP